MSPDRHSGGGTVHRGGSFERALCIAVAWHLGLRHDLVRRRFLEANRNDPNPDRGALGNSCGDTHAAANTDGDGYLDTDTFGYSNGAHANPDGHFDRDGDSNRE